MVAPKRSMKGVGTLQTEAAMEIEKPADDRWRRVQLLMGMAGLLILAVAAVAFQQGNRLREQMNRATEVQKGVDLLREYSRLLVDLETGQRGYLLTGDPGYLQPYRTAENRLPMLSLELTSLMNQQPQTRTDFFEIGSELDHRKLELDMAISIFREAGRGSAIEYMRSGFGKALMDELRSKTLALTEREQARAESFRERSVTLVEQRNWTIFVIAVLGLVAGATGQWMVRGHLRRVAMESSLRAEAAEATRENQEKTSFLANMSHEIRTPMNAIFGFTQLLEEIVQGERQRFYVKAIQQSGKALLDLINDILDLSRIEAGKLRVEPVPTDLREMFGSLQTVFSQMVMEKGLQLRHCVDPSVPDALLLDPIRLRQILINLLGNAIKYTDQGTVVLSASALLPEDGDEEHVACVIEVSDTGIGIAAADQARIFEPFTQVDGSDGSARSGTGLGLAIVKRLAALLGCRIGVASTLGVGTTLSLHFASVPISSVSVSEPAAAGQLRELAPLRIVAIDDIDLNLKVFEGMFSGSRHELYCAASAEEGLVVIAREHPDLVLMDIRMPGMDGVEALRRIRAETDLQGTIVVAVTASSLLGDEQGLRAQFDGYVRKPITRQSLFAELSRLFPARAPRGSKIPADAAIVDFAALDTARRDALIIAIECCLAQLDVAVLTQSSSDIDNLLAGLRALVDETPIPALEAQMTAIARDAALFDLRSLEHGLAELRLDIEERIAQLRAITASGAVS